MLTKNEPLQRGQAVEKKGKNSAESNKKKSCEHQAKKGAKSRNWGEIALKAQSEKRRKGLPEGNLGLSRHRAFGPTRWKRKQKKGSTGRLEKEKPWHQFINYKKGPPSGDQRPGRGKLPETDALASYRFTGK